MKVKILKKNQVVIFVIALMLMAAGYLNYTSNQQYAGIGDARLVSSNGIVENSNIVESNTEEIKENTLVSDIDVAATSTTNNSINNNIIENIQNNNNTQTTSSAINTNEYFSSSRLNRDKMYSQMLESYEKILENETIPSDQKSIAQTEIKNINDLKNSLMICENLIKTKGFEDVIIFVNNDSISIIIKSPELTQEQIAQIQNIVSRELKASIENIHISNK